MKDFCSLLGEFCSPNEENSFDMGATMPFTCPTMDNANWGNQQYQINTGKSFIYFIYAKMTKIAVISFIIKFNLILDFCILGDFCGKRNWWFQGKGKKWTEPKCNQRMNILFFFEYDYCTVDMMKPFSDPDNAK